MGLLAVALALAGCSDPGLTSTPSPITATASGTTGTASGTSDGASTSGTTGVSATSATGAAGGSSAGPDTSGVPIPSLTPVDDRAGVGENGRAMLRGERSALVLEVDWQAGVQGPDLAALNHLVSVLKDVTRFETVRLAGGNEISSSITEWTTADLKAAADANRSQFSGDGQVSIYALYARGGFFDAGAQTDAIGVAHSASEVALFPDRWGDLVGGLLGSSVAIERAVLVHEAGHLFGLVNITYTSDIAHADPDNPHHSSSADSVMHPAIDTTLIGQLFSGSPPDDFDADDRSDLDGLASGRL